MARSIRILLIACAVSAPLANAARAEDDEWSQCGAGVEVPRRPVVETTETETDPEAIYMSADDADLSEDGVSTLRGNVTVAQGTRRIRSDELVYTASDEIMDARGAVRFWDDGVFIAGDGARAELAQNTITMKPVERYALEDSRGHGSAAEMTTLGNELMTANDLTYTTCDPDQTDWRVIAGDIEFDRVEETGTARDTWLEFKGQRVFYLPWLSFPLGDRRKSGFLAPTFGVDSSSGVDVTTPYYFNLAPNYDATVGSRAMSERGVQAQGEFRFLTRSFGSGRTVAHYLPSDAKYDDDRAAFDLEHRHRLSDRWSTEARFEWVSDAEYYEDFGTRLSQSSRTHLPRRFDANYRADALHARVRLEDFLTVDRTIPLDDRPYARIPQVLVRTNVAERNRALNFGATAELTSFDRRSSTTGVRALVQPSLSYPVHSGGAFAVPKATLHLTGYDLSRIETDAYRNDAPSRLLPTFSLDGGTFLERPYSLADRTLTHTLEPRLYYLLVPYDHHDDVPNFDSTLSSFSFAQLFRENRFSGADRIGDANQLTLALTSRVLDDHGEERVRASVGQIHYFRDRKVTLSEDEKPQTTGVSDIIAGLETRPAREWRLRTDLQYDTGADRTEKSTLNLRYQPDRRSVFNAALRFLRDDDPTKDIKQADLSFAWPLGTRWRGVGRWSHALNDDRNKPLEVFGGIEYESCCWGLRVVAQRFLNRGADSLGGEQYANGIFVQFELKGLTGVGSSADAFLTRTIPGYENEF